MGNSITINTRLLASKMALKGYSRKKLAEQANISIHTVNNIFTHDFNPRYESMITVSKALDLSVNEAAEIFFDGHLRKTKVIN